MRHKEIDEKRQKRIQQQEQKEQKPKKREEVQKPKQPFQPSQKDDVEFQANYAQIQAEIRKQKQEILDQQRQLL